MNPDDYIEGTHNRMNPANWNETIDLFESDNILECLDYAKDSDDFEPIENAIIKQETIIENAINELQFLMDSCNENVWMRNKLIAIKSKLKSTQIKNYEI